MVEDDFLSLLQTIILEEIPTASINSLLNIESKLQLRFGGERFYIPKRDIILTRNNQIYADYLSGYDVYRLSAQYGLSVSSIRKIIYNHR